MILVQLNEIIGKQIFVVFFLKVTPYPIYGGESGVLMLKIITKLKVPTAPLLHRWIGITSETVEIEKLKSSYAIIFAFRCHLALTRFFICLCHHMTLVSLNIFTRES